MRKKKWMKPCRPENYFFVINFERDLKNQFRNNQNPELLLFCKGYSKKIYIAKIVILFILHIAFSSFCLIWLQTNDLKVYWWLTFQWLVLIKLLLYLRFNCNFKWARNIQRKEKMNQEQCAKMINESKNNWVIKRIFVMKY